jgi:uncharacterized Zn-finger protein
MMVQPASLGSHQDVVRSQSSVVSCDGRGHKDHRESYEKNPEEAPLGHPLVYLAMGKKGRVACPYCRRQFALVEQSTY